MWSEPSRRLRVLLALAAGSAIGCGPAAAPPPDTTAASPAEAAAMAPPPEPELLRRAEALERAALAALPAGAGHDVVVGGCITCHSATMLTQQRKDSAGWSKTVATMVGWGAPVTPAQQPVLVAYLAEHYPARAQGPAAKPVP